VADDSKPASAAAAAVDLDADAKQLADGMAAIRSLLQRTATAIGAVATAVIGGLGYAQLHNAFPIPQTAGPGSKTLLGASLIAAIAGSAWLAGRFFSAQRRILLATEPEPAAVTGTWDRIKRWVAGRRQDPTAAEQVLVRAVLDEHAAEEVAASLYMVELRALRLGRLSRRLATTDEQRSSALALEAKRLEGTVSIALTRAAATLLEDRARRVFRGWPTVLALTIAAAGLVGLFATVDYYKGQRTLFEMREKCAKAETAGVTDACAPFETKDVSDVRRAQAAAKQAREKVKQAFNAQLATDEQKASIARVVACSRAINADETSASLDPPVKSNAIALCATSTP
jgi:hypothetical protein